jgi:polyisoprenoid-binding protein YceI
MRLFILNVVIILSFTAILSVVGVSNSWAIPLPIDPLSSSASFVAVGKPARLRIHGESQNLRARLELEEQILNGELILGLSELKTGIEMRDEHMKKKYLEVERFPEATLKIKDLAIPIMKDGESRELKFAADLNLHGIDHTIQVLATIKMNDHRYDIQATSSFQLSDFKVEIPVYAGIKVADLVDLDIRFKTK